VLGAQRIHIAALTPLDSSGKIFPSEGGLIGAPQRVFERVLTPCSFWLLGNFGNIEMPMFSKESNQLDKLSSSLLLLRIRCGVWLVLVGSKTSSIRPLLSSSFILLGLGVRFFL
jgi:hypothetical protein